MGVPLRLGGAIGQGPRKPQWRSKSTTNLEAGMNIHSEPVGGDSGRSPL
jgi:hypothetical protein